MPTCDRDWLGWTEADHEMVAFLYGWGSDPPRQGLEDSNEFLNIVLYCTYRTKSA